MLYLLDANVLIDANRDYYPIADVEEFWGWLVELGNKGIVKIPIEVYEEIKEGRKNDALAVWAKDRSIQSALLFTEESVADLVSMVVEQGYSSDLTDDEIEKLGRDPFLVAYALVKPLDRCIVTTEGSKPSKIRGNRRLPDVCDTMNVKHCHTHQFTKELKFSTKWKIP